MSGYQGGGLAQAWRCLGIARTGDQGAIRRAYADALRAMDVDADVAGFAALRAARDTALAWARRQGEVAPPPEVAEVVDGAQSDPTEADFTPGVWPYAAPRLVGEGHCASGGFTLGTRGVGAESVLVPASGVRAMEGSADPQFALAGAPFALLCWHGAVVEGAEGVGPTARVRDDHGLQAILLEGPGVEFALTEGEEAQAAAHMTALIHRGEAGSADVWARTEEWLAETLARGWPRSAPLLEQAAQAFGWAGREATTADSPAIAFLVPRVGHRPATRPAQPVRAPLHTLLIEEGHVRDPLGEWQEAHARSLLAAIVKEAEAGDVEAHQRVEAWLADLLVEAWPRSAPLLEPAAAAFGWDKEYGKLDERPAIAFLNARLRGLRFVDDVRAPGHRLGRAWRELTRTGQYRNPFVSRREVQELLQVVRGHFPELEDHFSPALVDRWERARSWWHLFSRRMVWFVLVAVVNILIRLPWSGHDGYTPHLPQALQVAESSSGYRPPDNLAFDPATDPVLAQAVYAMFGPDVDFATLRRRNPNLAETILANRRRTADVEGLVSETRMIVRLRMADAIRTGKPARLDALARWRLGQLVVARRDGGDTCMALLSGNSLPDGLELSPAQAAQEQHLAKEMLAAGELDPPRPPSGKFTFKIPGLLIERVVAATGLSAEVVKGGLINKGTPAQVCAVRMAVLSTALDWKGAARTAILRAI